MNSVHYSSKSNEWETPQDLYDELNNEFHFTLDPCCTKESSKCEKYYTIDDDGLTKDWSGEVVFMNPPYGREIKHWIKKASESKVVVVALIPARTDTSYWHDYILKRSEVRFLRGRIKFGNAKHGAPFPSAVVIFNGG